MPLSQADRIAFSAQIVGVGAQNGSIAMSQSQIQASLNKIQALDTANKNLFTPVNTQINGYQNEIQLLDGKQRTQITEQDLINASLKVLQNHFFPNDTSVSIPDLSGSHNIWKFNNPFALGYGIGRNYQETNTTITKEGDLIAIVLANLSPTVNPVPIANLITFVNNEITQITTNDTDSTRQSQNNAAISNAQAFVTAMTGNTNPASITALTSARTSFIATRVSQITANLGTIVQSTSDGTITSSSGFYGQRYPFLDLRLNALTGSLTQLSSGQAAVHAQSQIIANNTSMANTYKSILPTSSLAATANGTSSVTLVDVSFLHPGDTVYVMADSQTELQRAVKSINGNMVVLNDIVPVKYSSNARLYKDIS